jgi:hypothetical protein
MWTTAIVLLSLTTTRTDGRDLVYYGLAVPEDLSRASAFLSSVSVSIVSFTLGIRSTDTDILLLADHRADDVRAVVCASVSAMLPSVPDVCARVHAFRPDIPSHRSAKLLMSSVRFYLYTWPRAREYDSALYVDADVVAVRDVHTLFVDMRNAHPDANSARFHVVPEGTSLWTTSPSPWHVDPDAPPSPQELQRRKDALMRPFNDGILLFRVSNATLSHLERIASILCNKTNDSHTEMPYAVEYMSERGLADWRFLCGTPDDTVFAAAAGGVLPRTSGCPMHPYNRAMIWGVSHFAGRQRTMPHARGVQQCTLVHLAGWGQHAAKTAAAKYVIGYFYDGVAI